LKEAQDLKMDRRCFVASLLAGTCFPAPAAFGLRNHHKVGLQLYTIRQYASQNLRKSLSAVSRIGYREVEFAGLFGWNPRNVRRILDDLGLSAPSAHIGYADLDETWSKVLEDAKILGHRFIVCPGIPEEHRTSIDDWKRVAEKFNQAAAIARRFGIQFAYHNHDFEFLPVQGILPYKLLLEETDPKLVRMELDVYWITRAKQDPLFFLANYPNRFPLLHLKDMTAQGEMADIGAGVIDFARILRLSGIAGVEHYFVEHDNSPAPFQSIATSFRRVARLLEKAGL
jgi:sugar phosphate isomerase/epimerase